MSVASSHVGFLPGLLAPFATLRSLLEAGGSTLNHAEREGGVAIGDVRYGGPSTRLLRDDLTRLRRFCGAVGARG